MPDYYHVVARTRKEKKKYLHAFTNLVDAERFIQVQEVPNSEIVRTTAHVDGYYGEVAFIEQPDGSVILDHTHRDYDTGLIDPYLIETASGLALWHIQLGRDGALVNCEKAFHGRFTCHEYPDVGEVVCSGTNLKMHCFAVTKEQAIMMAVTHYQKVHAPKLADTTAAYAD